MSSINEIPFGGGYAKAEKEFDEALREIPLMGYALVMISHAADKVFTDENGEEFNRIIPTLNKRGKKVSTRMADVYGYTRGVETEEGIKTMLFMRGTPRYEAGSRFKYIVSQIELNYENLANAIADAIQEQEDKDGAIVVDNKESIYEEQTDYDFEVEMTKAQEIISSLMEASEDNAPRIVAVVEEHLGKGKKLNQATEEQVDIVVLITDDLKDLLTDGAETGEKDSE